MSDAPYLDDDLVYVDPETRTVVGKVELDKNGIPKQRKYVAPPEKVEAPKPLKEGEKPAKKRTFNRKFYPWGTYRSMKRVYKVEGKIKEPESNETLEQVLPKALESPFWD